MRVRSEKLRPHLQAMELLVAGKKAAAEEAARPSEPIVDEFADGCTA